MTRPKLVIFDCDGVLVDSEGIFATVLAKSLTRHGFAITPAECLSMFTGGTMANVKTQATEKGAVLGPDWIDELYAEADAELSKGVPVIDGIPELLDQLDYNHVPYCIGSNGRTAKMKITLGQNGLLERFAGRSFSAYDVGISKPDPGLFLHAAQELGVAPQDCVVIEDSLTGVTAAKRAEIKCYAYCHDGDGADLIAQDAILIRSIRELPDLLSLT